MPSTGPSRIAPLRRQLRKLSAPSRSLAPQKGRQLSLFRARKIDKAEGSRWQQNGARHHRIRRNFLWFSSRPSRRSRMCSSRYPKWPGPLGPISLTTILVAIIGTGEAFGRGRNLARPRAVTVWYRSSLDPWSHRGSKYHLQGLDRLKPHTRRPSFAPLSASSANSVSTSW